MKPTWLIERGVFPDQANALQEEAARQGFACHEITYRPGKDPPNEIVGRVPSEVDACVVFLGTLPLMRQIQLHRQWVPGGWCNVDHLACSTYYPHFRRYLLNCDHVVVSAIEAIRQRDQLFSERGVDDELFVRPDAVQKTFPGTAVFRDNFADAIAAARYDPECRIVVSSPKEIGSEWRLVVVDDKVVAASKYRDHGAIAIEAGCPEEVLAFAGEVLDKTTWRPDRAFIMDVCESSGDLAMVELNSFSCSGLYRCDLAEVIRAASTAAESDWRNR